MDVELVEKFESRYILDSKTGCWIWIAGISNTGYGQITHKRKPYMAHRLAYEIFYKRNPGKKYVLHTCDNPKCVNPKHLLLGTQKDNMQDMLAKKRNGQRFTPPKLDEEKVKQIHQYLAFGMTQIIVAKKFGVSKNHISTIKHRHCWKHVQLDGRAAPSSFDA